MIEVPTDERLKACGFLAAAEKMQKYKAIATPELRDKLRIAFEHYRVVEPKHVERFNRASKERTKRRKLRNPNNHDQGYHIFWEQLAFTPIENYTAMPPVEVLTELEKAIKFGCFDYFEVATLETVSEYHEPKPVNLDPILFGRIKESENRYFIAQWDDDVRIEEILREDEG